nr:hypothetical protein [Streptomyces sp. SID12501]
MAPIGRPYRLGSSQPPNGRPGTAETPLAPAGPSRPANAPSGRPYLPNPPVTDSPQPPNGRPGTAETPSAPADPPRPANNPSGRPYLSNTSAGPPPKVPGSRPGTAETPPAPAERPRPANAPSAPVGRPYLPDATPAPNGRPGTTETPPAPVGPSRPASTPSGRPNPPLADSPKVPGAAGMPAAPVDPPRTASGPPAPGMPDPALSWSASYGDTGPVGSGRPVVSLGQPDVYVGGTRARSFSGRALLAVACAVLGLGLIGGALTGSWLTGDETGDAGASTAFTAAGTLWHSVPVDQLFPPTIEGDGAGPGGADRTWTRIAVAPDTGCADAFDPLLRKALAPVGCQRLLRATYTDETQSYVTTVGLLFTKADATTMRALRTRFNNENLDRRTDLMPRPYAAKNTVADDFTDAQRASWTISVLTDAPVVAYAVSGWADGRTVDAPQPAEEAMTSGATTALAQAGLGHEAQGLADRVERALRKTVGSAAKLPS